MYCGRCGGVKVSALNSRPSGVGPSPGQGHCVVFLGKTLQSHSASRHPGVLINGYRQTHLGVSKNSPTHFLLQKLR